MISDSSAAVLFFWLFIAAALLAMFWQLRAEHWKTLFETSSKEQFYRYAKEYINQMPTEELLRSMPREWVETGLIARLMVEEWLKK